MSGYITPGYDQDYYPKAEPVIPRVYHEHLSVEALANLYTEEQIANLFNKAYFVSNPDRFAANGYNGAICKYVNVCNSGMRLLPGTKDTTSIVNTMSVKNIGNNLAYVRLFIAIPSILDDAQPTFDASKNILHFNTPIENLAIGKWNFGKALDREAGKYVGPSGWNYYTTTIDNIAYNVYVATYETAIVPGVVAPCAISQVYLEATTSEEDIIEINTAFGTDNWQLLAVAEAVAVAPENDQDAFAAFAEIYEEVGDGEGKHNPFK